MAATDDKSTTVEYLKWTTETDLEDVHILRRDTAERVLTKERMRLLEKIETGELDSVRDLARCVDRNVSIVSRDLKILYEAEVIEYESSGRARRPVLAHENIFIKPVVFKGRTFSEEESEDTSEITAD
jgi:predicted transcriptional regulator